MRTTLLSPALEDFSRSLVETVHEPLLVLTRHFRVQLANQAFYRRYHLAPSEAEGRVLFELAKGQWNIPPLRALLSDSLPQLGSIVDYRLECRPPGAGESILVVNARQLRESQAQETLILLALEDLTERERMARELGEARARLDAFSEKLRQEERLRRRNERHFQSQKLDAVGRLAAGVAHQFNNALTAINGYADLLLQETPPGDPRHAKLEEIRKAGEKAAVVTRHLLSIGRRQILQPRTVVLNDVLEPLAGLVRKMAGKQVEVRMALAPDLRPAKVDPSRMEQVVLSLVVNALEAMEGPGILTLETGNRDVQEDVEEAHQVIPEGSYAFLALSDTGKGISPEKRASLFDPFYSTKPMGSAPIGLGLSSLYGFVRQSGGYLEVESESGRGTRFCIFLPQAS